MNDNSSFDTSYESNVKVILDKYKSEENNRYSRMYLQIIKDIRRAAQNKAEHYTYKIPMSVAYFRDYDQIEYATYVIKRLERDNYDFYYVIPNYITINIAKAYKKSKINERMKYLYEQHLKSTIKYIKHNEEKYPKTKVIQKIKQLPLEKIPAIKFIKDK